MNLSLPAGTLTGSVRIPASKSQAHRLLICAALGESPVTLRCDGISRDIDATARCLQALGAQVTVDGSAIRLTPGPQKADLNESATLQLLQRMKESD
jgi:3-phosphoshikimate 1-carboxyvinyltransferase